MSTTRRIPLAETIAKQVAEAIKAELRTELTTLIEEKFAELKVGELEAPEDENPDFHHWEEIICETCGETDCDCEPECEVEVCDNCGGDPTKRIFCVCSKKPEYPMKPCGHPIIFSTKDKTVNTCNCYIPEKAPDNIYDEDLANQIHYHRLTQCFTGDFTRNYPADIDFVESYQQCIAGYEGEANQFTKAYNDARTRFQDYNAKADDPSHFHNEQAQHSYFHMLKNKIINMSGIKEKIESAISKLQRAEIYVHGRDAVMFKEGIKELTDLL